MGIDSTEFFVGTAAWTIPPSAKARFATQGSHLERYGGQLRAVEINTSFYREHRPATYARWQQSVPPDFRFAVKFPKLFSHVAKLDADVFLLRHYVQGMLALGPKLGVILVQLPPSLAFDPTVAAHFFTALRENYAGPLVCEPRHVSWAAPRVQQFFARYNISKVLADPDPCPVEDIFAWQGSEVFYLRLHGSPQVYRTRYEIERLVPYARLLREAHARGKRPWCIFDNTTLGAATDNAFELQELLIVN